jgi:hypothetical protein
LSLLRRRIPLQGKPSKLTLVVTGSTVITAAAASGVMAFWPPAAASKTAAGTLTAAREGTAGSAQPEDSTSLATQVQLIRAMSALRQEQSAVRSAHEVAAQQAAARKHAAELAARRAAAEAAAAQAAQQQARQDAQQIPAAPVPSGSPQQIAMGMLGSYGWSSSQFSCLDSLWNEESGWNVYATNPSSGAYGIPQALPGSKMASAGPDWQTDAATQIRWGLTYIRSLYGSPCGAWAHEEADGWY